MKVFTYLRSMLLTMVFFASIAQASTSISQQLQCSGVRVLELGDMVDIVIPADRLFLPNEARLKYSGQWVLDETLAYINQYGNVNIKVNAHTDEIGLKKDKLSLSKLRAQSVMTYFWANGKDLYSMNFYGMADEQPIADMDTVPGGYFNRRVDIMFWRNDIRA